MRLLWITDPHLNCNNPYGGPRGFGQEVAANDEFDAVLMTGDIAEAGSLRTCVASFHAGAGKPLYFILGNHDYYGGSFAGVHEDVAGWAVGDLHWITRSGVISIGEGVNLCGIEGWYDGRAGDLARSNVRLNDFRHILDFARLHPARGYEVMRETAAVMTRLVEPTLRSAAGDARKVVFATHVPPFPGATWHLGKVSDYHWQPWMCNVTMGEMLVCVADDFPGVEFLVLCGHTHSRGEYIARPNLRVLSGRSEYGLPQVSGVLNF
jgi:3',5'-cyclic-AMP phosphodiesterase